MSKMSNLPLSDVLFQALNAPKLVFGQGFDPDPAGGAYDAPPRLLSRLGRGPSPYHSLRRLRHLDLGDCGASIDTSPRHKFLASGYAYGYGWGDKSKDV